MIPISRRSMLTRSSTVASALATMAIPNFEFCRQPISNFNPNITYHRLNWNENPYGPPPAAKKALETNLSKTNHYPDPLMTSLKESLAKHFGIRVNNLLLTSGSTEALCLIGQHIGLKKGEILTPWPSFPTLPMFGERCGAKVVKVPLQDDLFIDFERLSEALTPNTSLVSICNPNNPTSTQISKSALLDFCRRVPENVLVCVDEAYIQYAENGLSDSVVDFATQLPNLVVCRTFSKAYGMAGLRLGYIISTDKNITTLQQRHLGLDFSISSLTLSACTAALNEEDFIASCIGNNEKGKEIVTQAFHNWDVKVAPSRTNFLYAESKRFENDVVGKLRKDGILITKWPDMKRHIRISIQRPEEMEYFVNRVEKYLT